MNLYTKPAACKIEGDQIALFVGPSCHRLNLGYARELIAQASKAIAEVEADIAARDTQA